MSFSINSSMVMGSMCVEGARGTCAEKAETEAILNPDSGLVDRLMLCSWQQRSKVKKSKKFYRYSCQDDKACGYFCVCKCPADKSTCS